MTNRCQKNTQDKENLVESIFNTFRKKPSNVFGFGKLNHYPTLSLQIILQFTVDDEDAIFQRIEILAGAEAKANQSQQNNNLVVMRLPASVVGGAGAGGPGGNAGGAPVAAHLLPKKPSAYKDTTRNYKMHAAHRGDIPNLTVREGRILDVADVTQVEWSQDGP